MKTLPIRVQAHNAAALRVAEFLQTHARVAKVNYPGLASHAQHQRAARLFEGFGGMLSFELKGGVTEAEAFLGKITVPVHAPSLGGVESLMVRPAAATHGGLAPEKRAQMGIDDSLIRFSVGLEDIDDLLKDLERALG